MNSRIFWFMVTVTPAILLVVLLAVSLSDDDPTSRPGLINATPGVVYQLERPRPEFSLRELRRGGSISQDSFLGELLLIDFWSSWCPPCQAEAETLAQVYLEYQDRGVEFLGIAVWDERTEVEAFLQRFDTTYPVAIDENGRVAVNFGVTGVPEKFLLNRSGTVKRHIRGPMGPNALRSLLNELLAEESRAR